MSDTAGVSSTQAWANVSDLLAQKSTTPQAATEDSLANKDVFLKLMVAQLQHQDPSKPQDGMEFVTQLAQFTQLEQSMSMSQNLEKIRDLLTPAATTETTQP